MEKRPVLDISGLEVRYLTENEVVCAVNGIDLKIYEGESVGLVGETGAGKTTTCLSIMQLIPDPPGLITGGKILFNGENMMENTEKRNAEIRGNGISMIFQDPMTALNPVMTVGEQLVEVVRTHDKVSKAEAKRRVIQALEIVGVKGDRFSDYPHQFSGGMKQRVVITMALLCSPALLIADEPTTALDVTIQAQILTMICNLQRKYKTSVIMITHDLGVVAETCDKVAIMYAGEIVEYGTLRDIFLGENHHPYTKGLFGSIPSLTEDSKRLHPIEGLMPDPTKPPKGCWFAPRCKECTEKCRTEAPPVWERDGHQIRCHQIKSDKEVQ